MEKDTASSRGMLPPLLDVENNHRGSGVGSVNAAFLPPLRKDREVSSLDQAGMFPGYVALTRMFFLGECRTIDTFTWLQILPQRGPSLRMALVDPEVLTSRRP